MLSSPTTMSNANKTSNSALNSNSSVHYSHHSANNSPRVLLMSLLSFILAQIIMAPKAL